MGDYIFNETFWRKKNLQLLPGVVYSLRLKARYHMGHTHISQEILIMKNAKTYNHYQNKSGQSPETHLKTEIILFYYVELRQARILE